MRTVGEQNSKTLVSNINYLLTFFWMCINFFKIRNNFQPLDTSIFHKDYHVELPNKSHHDGPWSLMDMFFLVSVVDILIWLLQAYISELRIGRLIIFLY